MKGTPPPSCAKSLKAAFAQIAALEKTVAILTRRDERRVIQIGRDRLRVREMEKQLARFVENIRYLRSRLERGEDE